MKKKVSFEDALIKLETIVKQLEKGEIPLEEALQMYSEGIMLAKVCLDKLNQAEKQVNEMLVDAKGDIAIKPLFMEEE